MKVTGKGQVTIPIEIRRKMGLLPDTEIEFHVSGHDLLIRKSSRRQKRGRRLISTMRGRASKRLSTDDIMTLTRGE